MPSQEELEQYAEILIRIGLNVQQGQPVSISSPIEAVEFVRLLMSKAYDAGASTVAVNWHDPISGKIRMQKELEEYLVQVPNWFIQKGNEQVDTNHAFLNIYSEDPDLLAGIDPKRISLHSKALSEALIDVRKSMMENRVSWLVCSIPTKDWASKMFPDESKESAEQHLWNTIFKVMRMDEKDPVAAWNEHLDRLERRADFLNQKRFSRLHYRAPGTDLSVELPELHKWIAARSDNEAGNWFVANMPTEEVFTLPKRDGIHGVLKSTMPLSYGGVIIEGIELKFEHGRITEYSSTTGMETLRELIETDEGSHFLGEIALVPVDSPISKLNTLFYNTLFDENASCHVAIGKAYPICLEGASEMSNEQLAQHGVNDSLTHVDFMIGSNEMDIDGILGDGSVIPLLRSGKWVIEG